MLTNTVQPKALSGVQQPIVTAVPPAAENRRRSARRCAAGSTSRSAPPPPATAAPDRRTRRGRSRAHDDLLVQRQGTSASLSTYHQANLHGSTNSQCVVHRRARTGRAGRWMGSKWSVQASSALHVAPVPTQGRCAGSRSLLPDVNGVPEVDDDRQEGEQAEHHQVRPHEQPGQARAPCGCCAHRIGRSGRFITARIDRGGQRLRHRRMEALLSPRPSAVCHVSHRCGHRPGPASARPRSPETAG